MKKKKHTDAQLNLRGKNLSCPTMPRRFPESTIYVMIYLLVHVIITVVAIVIIDDLVRRYKRNDNFINVMKHRWCKHWIEVKKEDGLISWTTWALRRDKFKFRITTDPRCFQRLHFQASWLFIHSPNFMFEDTSDNELCMLLYAIFANMFLWKKM